MWRRLTRQRLSLTSAMCKCLKWSQRRISQRGIRRTAFRQARTTRLLLIPRTLQKLKMLSVTIRLLQQQGSRLRVERKVLLHCLSPIYQHSRTKLQNHTVPMCSRSNTLGGRLPLLTLSLLCRLLQRQPHALRIFRLCPSAASVRLRLCRSGLIPWSLVL